MALIATLLPYTVSTGATGLLKIEPLAAVTFSVTEPNLLCQIQAESEQRWQLQHSSKN